MAFRRKTALIAIPVLLIVFFITWRFVRPMNIFVVSKAFERPIDTTQVPEPFKTLSGEECGSCHAVFFSEWRSTIHSQAWTDPYFQVDWEFDGRQQICLNCHTPLDRQQPELIAGFRDKKKLKPITKPNPGYDRALRHEGVTCAACHLRKGKIVGVLGNTDAPHPVKKIVDANNVCMKCHLVSGAWDTLFRYPPCGTVAELGSTPGARPVGRSGEVAYPNRASLGCVQCHMPAVDRPLVEGGVVRSARQHLWRGGHDPGMVKKALYIKFSEQESENESARTFSLMLMNIGAAHFIPTGTPDRHLTVELRVLNRKGKVIREKNHKLIRTLMWRPVIIDLWDTRLPRWDPRIYTIEIPESGKSSPSVVEAVVRYHLLAEERRQRIGYENREPIHYEVFRRRISLADGKQPK